jgi:hypothetical protein
MPRCSEFLDDMPNGGVDQSNNYRRGGGNCTPVLRPTKIKMRHSMNTSVRCLHPEQARWRADKPALTKWRSS